MSSWATGPFGHGPWGGGVLADLGLVRNFLARNSNPNEISLTFKRPANFDSSMELIIVRRKDAFPMELYNDDIIYLPKVNVSGFTDPTQIEIYRARTIYGSGGVGTPGKLTDVLASFPTIAPLGPLTGRILRDSTSHNFRILSNTGTEIFVNGIPASGQYTVLVDFPNENETAITGVSTSVGLGFLIDTTKSFEAGILRDRILVDQSGNRFIIRNNGPNILNISGTPVAGSYIILQEFADFISPSATIKGQFTYIDKYLNKSEALFRVGTGLEDEQFYYYTALTHRIGGNVAESSFAIFSDSNSTQSAALSTIDRDFQDILMSFWPNVFKAIDSTGDFQDAMTVFGFGFNEIYSFVNTFDLTNPDKMFHTVLPSKSRQTGISSAEYSMGVDHMRRIVNELLSAWKLKGSKRGIVDFIRILTTWDVTNGTGDPSEITDNVPNIGALRFYSAGLGSDNLRLFGFVVAYLNDPNEDGSSPFVSYTYAPGTGIIQYSTSIDLSSIDPGDPTNYFFVDGAGVLFEVLGVSDSLDQIEIAPSQTVNTSQGGNVYQKTPLASSGRFFTSKPGIIIPGFFSFKEFVVEVKDVALFVGESTDIELIGNNKTRLTDTSANFGGTNNLKGNFLLAKQGQVNDIFIISSNTTTSITVEGVVNDLAPVGDYAVLSPLNTIRFQTLLQLMTEYAPSFARIGIQFT